MEPCLNQDFIAENQKELVTDLVTKAKQIEYLINSLPQPEPEENQVRKSRLCIAFLLTPLL